MNANIQIGFAGSTLQRHNLIVSISGFRISGKQRGLAVRERSPPKFVKLSGHRRSPLLLS